MAVESDALAGATRPPTPLPSSGQRRSVPGEVGIWVFVLGDMTVFALFFCIFAFYHRQNPSIFEASQHALNHNLGAGNTVLLLTSSLFVVLAVRSAKYAISGVTPRLLALAALCGLTFVILKLSEYRAELSQHNTPRSNDFFMYYYIFTGIHLLHVVIGLGVLSVLIVLTRNSAAIERRSRLIESGGIYWHMVDLLWLVLFSLFYLM